MTTDKARSLTEQIEASVNRLASETDEARQSELFKRWLNAMAQFHRYSVGKPATHRFPTPGCFFRSSRRVSYLAKLRPPRQERRQGHRDPRAVRLPPQSR